MPMKWLNLRWLRETAKKDPNQFTLVRLAILPWPCSITLVIQASLGSTLKTMSVSKPSRMWGEAKKFVKIMDPFSFILPKMIVYRDWSLNIGLIVVAYLARKLGLWCMKWEMMSWTLGVQSAMMESLFKQFPTILRWNVLVVHLSQCSRYFLFK